MTQNMRAHAYEIPSWAIAMTLYGGSSRREEKMTTCECCGAKFTAKAYHHLKCAKCAPNSEYNLPVTP